MDTSTFATRFEAAFRSVYARAARRIRDKRQRLSPETTALLHHLGLTGPLSLTELARHTGRANSTMSEMVGHMVAKRLLERDRDPADSRRALIWLSPHGQNALLEASSVLDRTRLDDAAAALDPRDRATLIALFEALLDALKTKGSHQ